LYFYVDPFDRISKKLQIKTHQESSKCDFVLPFLPRNLHTEGGDKVQFVCARQPDIMNIQAIPYFFFHFVILQTVSLS